MLARRNTIVHQVFLEKSPSIPKGTSGIPKDPHPPGKVSCFPPCSFRELLWKRKLRRESNFGVWLCTKIGSKYSYPKGTSRATKDYSCVIWLKSIQYFQSNGNTLKSFINTVVWVQGTPPCCKWNCVNSRIRYVLYYRPRI